MSSSNGHQKLEIPPVLENWKETTCVKAKKMQHEGIVIWWRPKGIVSKDPDNDAALYR